MALDNFPFYISDQCATSAEIGIAPPYISHEEYYADEATLSTEMNRPISEKVMSQLTEDYNVSVKYNSIDDEILSSTASGFHIFHSQDGALANYISLSASSENLSTFIDDNGALVLSGGNVISGDFSSVAESLTSIITGYLSGTWTHGGQFQHSHKIPLDMVTSGGYKISTLKTDNVLANIFIRQNIACNTATDVKYSIGTSAKPFEFISKFTPKTTIATYTVDEYCRTYPFYYWVSAPTDLVIYKYGAGNITAGELDISIFYDEAKWNISYGYIRPYSTADTFTRYNLETDTELNVSVGAASYTATHLGTAKNSNVFYNVGGYESGYKDNIEKYDTRIDVNTALDKGNLTVARKISHDSCQSSTHGLFMGGDTGVSTNLVDRLDFSNDTVDATTPGNLVVARKNNAGAGSGTYIYTAGGNDGSYALNSIEKITTSTFASSVLAATLADTIEYSNTLCNNKYVYFIGGYQRDHGQVSVPMLSMLDQTTDTVDSKVTYLPATLAGFVMQTEKSGYVAGGYFHDKGDEEVYTDERCTFIYRFDFGTETYGIANNTFQNTSSIYPTWKTTSNSC